MVGKLIQLFPDQIRPKSVALGKLAALSAASKLIGSPSTGTAPQEITLGTGLSMSSGTLSASTTSAGGTDTQVQFNDGGTALGGDAGLTYNKSTDALTAGSVSLSNGQLVFPASQNA